MRVDEAGYDSRPLKVNHCCPVTNVLLGMFSGANKDEPIISYGESRSYGKAAVYCVDLAIVVYGVCRFLCRTPDAC